MGPSTTTSSGLGLENDFLTTFVAAIKDVTDLFSPTYVLMSSCRKRLRLSRLESFTKRVSKKKLFTSAAFSQVAPLLSSRWLLDLWWHPWPRRHPLRSPSSMLVSMWKHSTRLVFPRVWCFLAPRLQLPLSFHHHLQAPWARWCHHSGAWGCSTCVIVTLLNLLTVFVFIFSLFISSKKEHIKKLHVQTQILMSLNPNSYCFSPPFLICYY